MWGRECVATCLCDGAWSSGSRSRQWDTHAVRLPPAAAPPPCPPAPSISYSMENHFMSRRKEANLADVVCTLPVTCLRTLSVPCTSFLLFLEISPEICTRKRKMNNTTQQTAHCLSSHLGPLLRHGDVQTTTDTHTNEVTKNQDVRTTECFHGLYENNHFNANFTNTHTHALSLSHTHTQTHTHTLSLPFSLFFFISLKNALLQ